MTLDAISPDDAASNSAAIACGSVHVWEGALSVLRGMELSRVPSDETYFETMTALVLKGRHATAVQLFRQWEASAGVRCRVSDTLFDLRGMRVEVSVIAVRAAVLDTMAALEAEGIQERRVVFITGRGAHSQNGALVRPAVLSLLRNELRMEAQLVKGNEGRTEAVVRIA